MTSKMPTNPPGSMDLPLKTGASLYDTSTRLPDAEVGADVCFTAVKLDRVEHTSGPHLRSLVAAFGLMWLWLVVWGFPMICGFACAGIVPGDALHYGIATLDNGTAVVIVDRNARGSDFRLYDWLLRVISALGARWQQLIIFPLAFIFTTTSSALWLTPRELVLSLGPIPVCIFRRRILHDDIASVIILRGRQAVVTALTKRGWLRPWRIHGYIFGLTLGKALVDVVLKPKENSSSGRENEERLLISVDDAEELARLINFRRQNGAEASLPVSEPMPTSGELFEAPGHTPMSGSSHTGLIPIGPSAWKESSPAATLRWVFCDALEVVSAPWRHEQLCCCLPTSAQSRNLPKFGEHQRKA